MAATAANPQAKAGTGTAQTKAARSGLAPGFSPVSRGAAPAGQRQAPASLAAAPSRRRGVTPLTPMRQDTAKSMSKLADQMKEAGPDIPAHQHVRDAARVLRSGNEEAAQRHLRAAIFALTPQSLHRQGVHNDDGHTAARTAMHGVHRHLLLVKDIADVAAKNQRMLARDSYGDLESAPTLPQSPERDGPDAGYGPGALAQKPTARQPGGDRALNAPDRTNSGGSDPNVADPVGPQPKGSKQFGYGWGDLASVIEMAWTGWLHERRNKGGAWTDGGGGTPSAHPGAMNQPAGLDDLARAAANKHPDVVRMVNQSKAAAAAGDMQRSHQLWQQASDLAVQKIQEYKDKAALKSMSGPPTLSSSKIQQELVDNSGDGGDPANDYRFSAETGRLAVTPAPYGKPGGPGLYHVKGLKHSDYLEQIVHALMRKGMDKGKATAIARGSIRRWMRGGGHVHPEVRAAAGVAEAEELKAQARAHAHANTWDEVAAVVELAFLHHFDPAEPRGKEGEWTGGLGGLADKLDADHPGKGFGDEVRKAKDAATTGDRDKAGEHLENAYEAVRGRAGAVGSKTAEGRKAAGNAFLLDQKMRQLSGGVALARARTWGDAAWEIELAAAAPGQARVPAGQAGGGQFGSSGGAASGAASGGSGSVASQHASLSAKISTARKRLTALQAQQKALQAALATASSSTTASQSGATTSSQSGATTAGQSGATTTSQAGATTASQAGAATAGAATAATTPSQSAATSSAAVTPSQAGATTAGQAGATTASQAGATTASQAGATTPSAASAASPAQVAQWTQQLGQVNQQITTVTNQITAWQKQLGQGSGGSSGSAQGAAA